MDPVLARKLRGLAREYSGTPGYYVQSLTGGVGRCVEREGALPGGVDGQARDRRRRARRRTPGSRRPPRVSAALLREMIVPSDDEAANALLVWLAGSTSAGGQRVNALMQSIGLTDTLMYGGYETRTLSGPIPARVDDAPAFGVGKYTTAWDMTRLWRAIWLASAGTGRSARRSPASPRPTPATCCG